MNSNLRIKYAATVAGVLAIILSSFSALLFYQHETKMITLQFEKHVDERAESIYREILINFETLRSLAILFNGDEIPQYSRFNLEAERILRRHDDIKAFEWLPRVDNDSRQQHVLDNQQRFPNYQLRELNENGDMVSAQIRDEYFPVSFITPLKGNELTLGFDFSSNVIRSNTLEISRETGKSLASASITLLHNYEKQRGFLAFLPVYSRPSTSINERRKNALGFIVGVYRIKDIFIGSALSKEAVGIQMTLVDKTISTTPEVLYRHQPELNSSIDQNLTYRKDLPATWGRKWCLMAIPTVAYIESKRSLLPQMIFIVGFGLAFLVIWYIIRNVQRTKLIESIVTNKTNELSEANKKLELLSRLDGLTCIANRRMLDETLDKEWQRAIRTDSELSFILIDIDLFKQYNDNYGHVMGDECLKQIAHALNHVSRRSSDLVARYGGEEFALVLADTDNAEAVAENCRLAIQNLKIPHEHSDCAEVVTASVGVCVCRPDINYHYNSLIESADNALYKAKELGRNRVCAAEHEGERIQIVNTNPLFLVE